MKWEYNNVRSPSLEANHSQSLSLRLRSHMYGGILIAAKELWVFLRVHNMQLSGVIGGEMLNMGENFLVVSLLALKKKGYNPFFHLLMFLSWFFPPSPVTRSLFSPFSNFLSYSTSACLPSSAPTSPTTPPPPTGTVDQRVLGDKYPGPRPHQPPIPATLLCRIVAEASLKRH